MGGISEIIKRIQLTCDLFCREMDRKSVNQLIVVAVLSSFVTSVNSLVCYSCDNMFNSSCEDPMTYSPTVTNVDDGACYKFKASVLSKHARTLNKANFFFSL
jgi:hypothetical protein